VPHNPEGSSTKLALGPQRLWEVTRDSVGAPASALSQRLLESLENGLPKYPECAGHVGSIAVEATSNIGEAENVRRFPFRRLGALSIHGRRVSSLLASRSCTWPLESRPSRFYHKGREFQADALTVGVWPQLRGTFAPGRAIHGRSEGFESRVGEFKAHG